MAVHGDGDSRHDVYWSEDRTGKGQTKLCLNLDCPFTFTNSRDIILILPSILQVSVLILSFMSVERWLCISWPLRAPRVSLSLAKITLAFMWLVGLALAVGPGKYRGSVGNLHGFGLQHEGTCNDGMIWSSVEKEKNIVVFILKCLFLFFFFSIKFCLCSGVTYFFYAV